MITGLGLFLSVIYLIGVKEIPLSAQAKEIDDAYKEAKGAAVIFSMEEENASNRGIGTAEQAPMSPSSPSDGGYDVSARR